MTIPAATASVSMVYRQHTIYLNHLDLEEPAWQVGLPERPELSAGVERATYDDALALGTAAVDAICDAEDALHAAILALIEPE